MVLGNYAMQRGWRPSQVTDWFHRAFIDGYDWVMVPNVVGMSQYADGGRITTKPYAGGGAYIDRMSDYCGALPVPALGPGRREACPFTAGYWWFLDRHRGDFAGNHRMAQPLRGLDRLKDLVALVEQERRERLGCAVIVRKADQARLLPTSLVPSIEVIAQLSFRWVDIGPVGFQRVDEGVAQVQRRLVALTGVVGEGTQAHRLREVLPLLLCRVRRFRRVEAERAVHDVHLGIMRLVAGQLGGIEQRGRVIEAVADVDAEVGTTDAFRGPGPLLPAASTTVQATTGGPPVSEVITNDWHVVVGLVRADEGVEIGGAGAVCGLRPGIGRGLRRIDAR